MTSERRKWECFTTVCSRSKTRARSSLSGISAPYQEKYGGTPHTYNPGRSTAGGGGSVCQMSCAVDPGPVQGENFSDQYHHLLYTWNTKKAALYLDGKVIKELEIKAEQWKGQTPFDGQSLSLRAGKGLLDDIMFFDRFAEADDVAAAMAMRPPAACAFRLPCRIRRELDGRGQAGRLQPGSGLHQPRRALRRACFLRTTSGRWDFRSSIRSRSPGSLSSRRRGNQ